MNPQLTFELNFSIFSDFFSSKKDDEEKKEKEKKQKQKKAEKPKSRGEENILKKDYNNSSKTSYTEDESKTINKKEEKKESQKSIKKEEIIIKEENIEQKNIIKEGKEDIKVEDLKEKDIKKEDIKSEIKEEVKNVIKEEKTEKKGGKKKKNKKEKKQKDDLLTFLVYYIKNIYLFRKKVKNLVKKHKENYAIISSVNKGNISMNIRMNEDQIKKVKFVHEPILNENYFYIPRKLYKKKNLLKFSLVNKKNESIIDPKFNTEYDEGEFINVINLKKIKDKEEENEEEFQAFLETYYTLKPSLSKETEERNKLSLGVVRIKKKHRTMDNKGGLHFGINKIPSNSILKQRPTKRIVSNKKISFSEINETIPYKKDD